MFKDINIFSEVIAFLIGSMLGLFFGQIKSWYIKWKYRNWTVKLMYQGIEIVERSISPEKTSEIFGEPSDKAVYVKGVISPYGRLGCDPLETSDLIIVDKQNKDLIINLDADTDFKPYDQMIRLVNPPAHSKNEEE